MTDLFWKNKAEALDVFSLIERGVPIVVGCSGGPDSVFLVKLMTAIIDPSLVNIVYVNHGLRSFHEIDTERQLVAELSEKSGAIFWYETADVNGYAARHACGVEAAGRYLRHKILFEIAAKTQATSVALGHHHDDSVETAVMKWFRGARSGLFGLKPSRQFFNGIRIIRPLLRMNKNEILKILKEKEIVYSHDVTNQDVAYKRNQIRHEVLPKLRHLIPKFDDKVSQLLSLLQQKHDRVERIEIPYMKFLVINGNKARYPLDVLRAQGDEALASLLKRICEGVYDAFFSTPSTVHVESKHIVILCDSVRKSKGKIELPRRVFAVIDPRGSVCFSKSYHGEISE